MNSALDYKNMDPDQFAFTMQKKYNTKKFRGLELRNAAGDIDPNSFAVQYAIDRLSYIRAKTVEQTFYEVLPSDYIDVIPGEGAFAQNIITNISIKTAGGFKQGKINTSGNNNKLAVANAMLTPVTTYVRNWALAIEYSLFDVEQSLFAGTWDIVEAKHRSRKKDFDLGIQEVAFLGDYEDSNFPGLFTQSQVKSNTTTLTSNISSLSPADFATFVSAIISAYLTNCNQTVFPNTFVIPQDDWAGLGAPVSATYPNVTKLAYLQMMFDSIVPKGKVRIMPSAYGMTAYNKAAGVNSGSGYQRYVLYRRDIDTLFMELPVDYQVTSVGTFNNFNFQDVAYAQYTGVQVIKPLELIYFDHT
jgi:Uncharacterized protein conserved in bacteria (DUF2184)